MKPKNKTIMMIEEIATKLNIDEETKHEAIQIYSKHLSQIITKGRRAKDIATACLYIATRKTKTPIPHEKFYEISPDGMFTKIVKLANKELKIQIKAVEPESYIRALTKQLNLSTDIEEEAINIIQQVRKTSQYKLAGRNPRILAGAALYLACKNKNALMTKKKISETLQITDTALRKVINILKQVKQQ